MYRPQYNFRHNPRFNQRPQWKPRGQLMPQHFVPNRFRFSGPPTVQNGNEFWCETCDKGFQTQQILDNHKLQHQKCNIDGCQFVAHPKVITKHIQMQHSTGLYKKIANINKPEDIKKWREERKRKYPTKENIEKKTAELKEKIERGEKMRINFGINNKRHNQGQQIKTIKNLARGKNQQQHNNYKTRHENNIKPPAPKRVCKIKPLKNDSYKLPSFSGIQKILLDDMNNEEDTYEESLIEDDIFNEELSTNINISSQTKPILCGALSSLICDYGSSDEEAVPDSTHLCMINNTPAKVEEVTKNNDKSTNHKKQIKPTLVNNDIDKSDDDSGPDEIKTKKEPIDTNIIHNTFKNKKIKKVKNNHVVNVRHVRKPKHNLPSTLLVKLLKSEIEHERNIILQCIRHVINNNFFDTPDNKN